MVFVVLHCLYAILDSIGHSLCVTPRSQDPVIFMWTKKSISLPLAHAAGMYCVNDNYVKGAYVEIHACEYAY